MKKLNLSVASSILLGTGMLLSQSASAALTGTQTATVNFQGVSAATYGWASEANTGAFAGNCPNNACFAQNGVVVGGVKEPLDSGSHYHRQGTTADREAQYHPDSAGVYVRLGDLSKFSLQSIYLDVTNGATGGNFVLYGFANATNPGMLSTNGAVNGNGSFIPSDPEGSLVTPIATYEFANDGAFAQNITLAQLTSVDADWSNIGAFWLTFKGFNHSPTTNYDQGSYPDWDLRIDDIVLGAAVVPPVPQVPVPGAVWLFGTGLMGLLASRKKRA